MAVEKVWEKERDTMIWCIGDRVTVYVGSRGPGFLGA